MVMSYSLLHKLSCGFNLAPLHHCPRLNLNSQNCYLCTVVQVQDLFFQQWQICDLSRCGQQIFVENKFPLISQLLLQFPWESILSCHYQPSGTFSIKPRHHFLVSALAQRKTTANPSTVSRAALFTAPSSLFLLALADINII